MRGTPHKGEVGSGVAAGAARARERENKTRPGREEQEEEGEGTQRCTEKKMGWLLLLHLVFHRTLLELKGHLHVQFHLHEEGLMWRDLKVVNVVLKVPDSKPPNCWAAAAALPGLLLLAVSGLVASAAWQA